MYTSSHSAKIDRTKAGTLLFSLAASFLYIHVLQGSRYWSLYVNLEKSWAEL